MYGGGSYVSIATSKVHKALWACRNPFIVLKKQQTSSTGAWLPGCTDSCLWRRSEASRTAGWDVAHAIGYLEKDVRTQCQEGILSPPQEEKRTVSKAAGPAAFPFIAQSPWVELSLALSPGLGLPQLLSRFGCCREGLGVQGWQPCCWAPVTTGTCKNGPKGEKQVKGLWDEETALPPPPGDAQHPVPGVKSHKTVTWKSLVVGIAVQRFSLPRVIFLQGGFSAGRALSPLLLAPELALGRG